MDPAPTIEAMRTAARALAGGPGAETVRAIQAAQDALDAAKAQCLAVMEQTREYEASGASTLTTWVRNELRLGAKDTAGLVRATATLQALPLVGQAALAGQIRIEHVAVFTYGLKHIGAAVVTDSQSWLLRVARANEPAKLFEVMRALRDAVLLDELDQAWVRGMDKQDFQVHPVGEGCSPAAMPSCAAAPLSQAS